MVKRTIKKEKEEGIAEETKEVYPFHAKAVGGSLIQHMVRHR